MSIWKLRATPSQRVNAVSIFWYWRALKGPIAALSLKYINHPAIILFYAPLYTEGEDFPHFLHYNTDLSPSTPPARRLAKDEGEGLPANVCLFGCFFYLPSLPCPPVLFHLFQHNLDFGPGANNDNDPFSLHAIFNNNVCDFCVRNCSLEF